MTLAANAIKEEPRRQSAAKKKGKRYYISVELDAVVLLFSLICYMSEPDHRKSLSALPETLPSVAEVSQVFKDFKQVLRMHRFQTPLQRANNLLMRQSSVALSQKQTLESEHVYNLLPPGHATRLKVDFLRMVAAAERPIALRIPVTLMTDRDGHVLLWTNSAGEVVIKRFTAFRPAFTAFKERVEATAQGKLLLPKFVHKAADRVASFHFSADSAVNAWTSTGTIPQRLQQFVQPATKSVSLVRVHWRDTSPISTFYFICRGPPQSRAQQSLVAQVPSLGRSQSEPDLGEVGACINRSCVNLIVQKSRPIPELDSTLQDCVRFLNSIVAGSRKVTEAVFDFVSDATRRWVLLACRGYRLSQQDKLKLQTLEAKQEIDMRYLMYPVVARRSIVRRKVNKSLRLGTIAVKRRMAVVGFWHKHHEYHPARDPALVGASSLLDVSSVLQKTASLKPEPDSEVTFCASMERPIGVQVDDSHISLMDREVSRYESLVQGSRLYKEHRRATVDLVRKHGGEEFWRPLLSAVFLGFMEDSEITKYFEEQVGVEEYSMIVSCMIRILQGNYNFYYKEALGRLHEKKNIKKEHYCMFVAGVEKRLKAEHITDFEVELVLKRFRQLEINICHAEDKSSQEYKRTECSSYNDPA